MSASGRTAPYDVVAPVLWPMTTSGGGKFRPFSVVLLRPQ